MTQSRWIPAAYLAVALCLCGRVSGFYIPGVAPTEYERGERLELKAVKMTSVRTQLPYEYYTLPFCKPTSGDVHYRSLNLGEVLRGDRIVNTPYVLHVMDEVPCQVLCDTTFNPKETREVVKRINEDYTLHMLADNLPAATVFRNLKTNELQYEDGFKIGFIHQKRAILNNHLNIVIKYHPITRPDGGAYRIVGFEVDPRSVAKDSVQLDTEDGKDNGRCAIPPDAKVMELAKGKPNPVIFTYTVHWEESDVAWASRWDIYLRMSDVQIHWFAICNSVAIVLFLSGILALIIIRTLRRDIARYNKDEEMDEALEETGWKLIHGDVFRPPTHPTYLVACLGSGIQILCMVLIIIGEWSGCHLLYLHWPSLSCTISSFPLSVFAMFGMLSPASRGALMTAAIVLFMFMG